MKITEESLIILRDVSKKINDQTFHHHYHILYDIVNSYPKDYQVKYLEIGCYAGGSACLVSQRPNTQVISIDVGRPIPPSIPKKNFNKLNIHNNNYRYIHGSSHEQSIKDEVLKEYDSIDVLFIDGDHSYVGVRNDFFMYSPLVKKGGYIIFDDYNDNTYSPHVKTGVDSLDFEGYEVLGEFGSEFGARPSSLKSNEFVIRKYI